MTRSETCALLATIWAVVPPLLEESLFAGIERSAEGWPRLLLCFPGFSALLASMWYERREPVPRVWPKRPVYVIIFVVLMCVATRSVPLTLPVTLAFTIFTFVYIPGMPKSLQEPDNPQILVGRLRRFQWCLGAYIGAFLLAELFSLLSSGQCWIGLAVALLVIAHLWLLAMGFYYYYVLARMRSFGISDGITVLLNVANYVVAAKWIGTVITGVR